MTDLTPEEYSKTVHIEVTVLHCADSGGPVGEPGSAHHMVPTSAGFMICKFCHERRGAILNAEITRIMYEHEATRREALNVLLAGYRLTLIVLDAVAKVRVRHGG